ncbi:hypothetical protein [Dietzia maris]|uniref:hypothetical protein n=1 Tax=Dietzia maris TaxID=37915 RepID=UPI00232B4D8C|nr:hypothetical protein [Dietzia maris]
MIDPKANRLYRFFGGAFGVAGILYIFVGPTSHAEYEPAAGIAAFAVLFVIAQAVERLVEWVTDFLKLLPNSTATKKERATRELRAANSAFNNNPTVASFEDGTTITAAALESKEAVVDTARTDIRFLAHGLAILLAAIAVTWMNYGILDSLGVSNFSDDLNRLLTALAAAGGSTALHELISRVQVAKENAQTAAA